MHPPGLWSAEVEQLGVALIETVEKAGRAPSGFWSSRCIGWLETLVEVKSFGDVHEAATASNNR